MLHGIGIGFATSQLTNVVLSDIPPQKAGSASGAAGMVRQVGTALGIALIGAIFVAQVASHLTDNLAHQSAIPAKVSAQMVKGAGDISGGAATSHSGEFVSAAAGRAINAVESKSISQAARPAVAFAGAVVTIGALISLLVPNIPAEADPVTDPTLSWEHREGDEEDDEDEKQPTPV